MPHHPGAGGEVEDALAGADVALQNVFFLVLEEGAKRGVDDGFGLACSAGGIEDVDRVIR